MTREARIVSSDGVKVLVGGGQSARLLRDLDQAVASGAAGLVSFGLCGALRPGLNGGDLVVESDAPTWLKTLLSAAPGACPGRVVGGDAMVASPREKVRLREESGADAVDMETHIVTACARAAGIPYAIIRSVSDPVDRALPTAVLAGMKPDGETNLLGVLAALARRPWELPALLRTAREAQLAFAALTGVRAALGPSLGCP